MERCAHCGINLAKIDPSDIVREAVVRTGSNPLTNGSGSAVDRIEPLGRQWCSPRCRDWARQREATR